MIESDKRLVLGPVQELTNTETGHKVGARSWSSPNFARRVSSATRSSLITILLLQPVFFLRSASRPDPTEVKSWGPGVELAQQKQCDCVTNCGMVITPELEKWGKRHMLTVMVTLHLSTH